MGYVIAIVLLASTAMGAWISNKSNLFMEETLSHSEIDIIVNSVKIYAQAIELFVKNNPNYQGEIRDSQLNLPSWFPQDNRIKKAMFSGRGYLYLAETPGLFSELHQILHGSLLLGRIEHRVIVHLTEGKTQIPLPPNIPDGYLVYVL